MKSRRCRLDRLPSVPRGTPPNYPALLFRQEWFALRLRVLYTRAQPPPFRSRLNRRVRQAYSRGRTMHLQLLGASARVRLTHPTLGSVPAACWEAPRRLSADVLKAPLGELAQ